MTMLEVTISLSENEVAAIDRAAHLERRTREEILRLAAREYARRYHHRRDNPEIRRAMATIDALSTKLAPPNTNSADILRQWRDTRR